MGRILSVAGLVKDGTCQSVGGIQMLVGQAHERRGALGRLDVRRPTTCHFDDLGWFRHDDMTIDHHETFNDDPTSG